MKQLFVCHTQYNLVLAIGLASNQDDLILFEDFLLTDELKQKLESYFQRTLFLKGNYPKQTLSGKQKLQKISDDNKSIKAFLDKYEHIFIVDDMCIQEMYIMKLTYRKNPAVEMSWLEDGTNSYFINSFVSEGMGATPFRRFIRKHVFSFLYGLYGFYDLDEFMGVHFRLTSIYVTYPDCVRKELSGKIKYEITSAQMEKGMRFMYESEPLKMEPKSYLIAMDMLSTYGDSIDKVNKAVSHIVQTAQESGKKVYCKYHPRETEELNALKNVEQLNSKVGIESYLINTTSKDITLVGFKSTALQVAKKMNFNVISLIRSIDDPDGESIIRFYKSIGVKVY